MRNWQNWQNEPLNTYITPPPVEYRHDNVINGIVVPGAQATITALLAGIASGGFAALIGAQVNPWQLGFAAGAGAGLASWLSYRNHWQWSVTVTLERLLQIDINQDGVIGDDRPEQEHIKIQLVEDGNHQQFIDLPYAEKLPALAQSLLSGRTFSQSAFVGNGRLFTRPQFEELRSELLKRGLMTWRNPHAPAQGCELTAAGRAICRRLAVPPSPVLIGGDD